MNHVSSKCKKESFVFCDACFPLVAISFFDGEFASFDTREVPRGFTIDCLLSNCEKKVVCLDMRLLKTLHDLHPIQMYNVIDVPLMYEIDKKRLRKTSDSVQSSLYEDVLRRLRIQLDVCKKVGFDMTRSIDELVTREVLEELMLVQSRLLRELYENCPKEKIKKYEEHTLPLMCKLLEIEDNGIFVDVSYIESQLKLSSNSAADEKCMRSMLGEQRDGLIKISFNPIGGKTGRMKVRSGFNFMAIPHGPARKAIKSRWDGGKIVSLDFNAIDYRCIVQSVGDKLRDMYKNADDFHKKTFSIIADEDMDWLDRDVVKQISYIYFYGGRENTLIAKTNLSEEKLSRVLFELDKRLSPIAKFRKNLHERAIVDGYVDVPFGGRVDVPSDSHEGKTLGLYAQGFSSVVFAKSLINLQNLLYKKKSKTLFTVHDEVVMDIHPEEIDVIEYARHALEGGAFYGYSFKVKCKIGDSYGEDA